MNIETRFNVGDKAFTIDLRTLRIREFEVAMVSTYTTTDGDTDVYLSPRGEYGYGDSVDETQCFHDRDSLIDHITKP